MTVNVSVNGDGVATLTIARPEKRNALNREIIEGIAREAGALGDNASLRAVILRTDHESVFSAGADINEMRALNADTAADFISNLGRAIQAVYDLPVPVICRIQGPCIGGAMELAAACDLRIASETATFCMPEVRVGIPSVIQAAILPRLMGAGRANWLVLSGDVIDATRAADWGFVEFLSSREGLDDAVADAVASILASAPEAVRAQKRLCRTWDQLPLSDAVQASIQPFADSFTTGEPTEFMARVLKK